MCLQHVSVFPRILDEINNLLEHQNISTFKSQILATLHHKGKLVYLFVSSGKKEQHLKSQQYLVT